MAHLITWLFVLISALNIKCSTAIMNHEMAWRSVAHQSAKLEKYEEIRDLFSELVNYSTLRSELTRNREFCESTRPINPALDYIVLPINDQIKQLYELMRSIDSALRFKKPFGNLQRAIDTCTDDQVKRNQADVDREYDKHSQLPLTLLPSNNYDAKNILCTFMTSHFATMESEISTKLNQNHQLTQLVGSPSSREHRFLTTLKSEGYKAGVSQCDNVAVERSRLQDLYWPQIKSEIQGFLAFIYANLMHFYLQGEYYTELGRVKLESLRRIERYFNRFTRTYDCTINPWNFRTSHSVQRVPVTNETVEFFVRTASGVTAMSFYDPFRSEPEFSILFESRVIQIKDQFMTIATLPLDELHPKQFQGYWVWYREGVVRLGKIGAATIILSGHLSPYSTGSSYPIQYFDIDIGASAQWIVKGVPRAFSIQHLQPLDDLYWCTLPMDQLSLAGAINAGLSESSKIHLKKYSGNTPWNSLNNYLVGCGTQWAKDIFNHEKAVVAGVNTDGIAVFICRHVTSRGKVLVGFMIIGCRVVDSNGSASEVFDYEVLIQP